MKCQECKRRKAVWRVGNGFAAKAGTKVCDDFVCRSKATGGYPAPLRALEVSK